MPEMNTSQRVDPNDLADDDVRSIPDDKVRMALYRVTEQIKRVLNYQEQLITDLYDAVTEIENELP